MMSSISNAGEGNFYYIEKYSKVDESFVDAIGSLFSTIASDIYLSIRLNKPEFLQSLTVFKTYGDYWKKINPNYYQI